MTEERDTSAPTFHGLREARPEADVEVARRVGIAGVVRRVLGVRRDEARIGRFVLGAEVGRGGMGVVYRARDPESGEDVALKLLEGRDERARARFRREAEVLRSLDHPRIVGYLDHGGADSDVDYLAMEWLDGADLARVLEAGPLPIGACIRLGYEAALGLAAAHALSVLHRDVKPSNVFLVGRDTTSVRLIDFGLAHLEERGARFTSTGVLLGTPQYMAPEQLRGEESTRTDVYGLGATLYHALVGAPPFERDHPGAVLLAVASEPAPSPRARRPEVPRDLDALVVRMLAKDPLDRPRDMHAVVAELAEWLDAEALPRESAPTFSLVEREPVPRDAHAPRAETNRRLHGRARELAVLHGELGASEEEGTGVAVMVVGAPGIGRTSLLRAFGNELEATRHDVLVLELHCDVERAGVPLASVSELLLHPRVRSLESVRAARGELEYGVRALRDRALDGDVGVLTSLIDRMRSAWFVLVDALLASGPLALFVDSAERLDLSSLRYLRRLLDHPSSRGRVVVFAPSAGAAAEELERTLGARPLRRIELAALGARASAALLDEAAPGLEAEARARVLEMAAGHPALLVALAERGGDATNLDESSLADARVAFSGFAPESRRILRAASLFEGTIPRALLAQLVGEDAYSPSFTAHLEPLVERHVLVRIDEPSDGTPGERFRLDQGLVGRVARDAITDAARRAGHLRIGAYFAAQPGEHPLVALRHFVAAEAYEHAAPLYVRAAEHALLAEDTAAVRQLVADALAHVTDPHLVGRLYMVRAEASFWDGAFEDTCRAADEASARFDPVSAEAFAVAGLAMTAAGQRGRNDEVRERLARTLAIAPPDAARDAWIVAVCRGVTQLSATSDEDLRDVALRLDAMVRTYEPSASARAWHLRVAVWRTLGDGYGAMLDSWMRAYAAHVDAGDRRSATQIQINLGSLYVWTGAFERAAAVLDDALATSIRLESEPLRRSAEYTRLKLLAERDPAPTVEAAARRLAPELAANPRMAAGAELYVGLSALRSGELALARDAAARARAAHGAAAVRVAADAVDLLASLDALATDVRAARADALATEHAEAGRLPEFDALVQLACIEALAHRPEERDARLARLDAELRAEADALADPLDRAYFLSRPYAHARVAALVARHR